MILMFANLKSCPSCHNELQNKLVSPKYTRLEQPKRTNINGVVYSIIDFDCGHEYDYVVSQFIGENDIEYYKV